MVRKTKKFRKSRKSPKSPKYLLANIFSCSKKRKLTIRKKLKKKGFITPKEASCLTWNEVKDLKPKTIDKN